MGYSVTAADGTIGEIEDFILDETKWEIDFLLVDPGKCLPGKKVLVSPKLVKEIDWENATVSMETSVEYIKNGPEYDPAQLINVVDAHHIQEHLEN